MEQLTNSGGNMIASTAGIRYESEKKSAGIAYVLWFFFWWISAHRFYSRQWVGGILQITSWLIGAALLVVGVGFIVWAVLGVWLIIDGLLIPGWIRRANIRLADEIEIRMTDPAAWEARRRGIRIDPFLAICVTVAGCVIVGWFILTYL